MAYVRTHVLAFLLASFWLGLGGARAGSADDFKVIVHPQNPVSAVSRDFLRDAFLKRATNWPGGGAVRPIDLTAKLPARERFLEVVLRKTATQLRSYWAQRIFSGLDVPPPEADSPQAALRYVLNNPGAVAYVPSGFDAQGAKVVELNR